MRLIAGLLLANLVAVLLFANYFYSCSTAHIVDCADSVVLVYNDYGHGSGAIIDSNCVLTAKHVVREPSLRIRTLDGDEHEIVEVRRDPDSDLALIFIADTFDERPLKVRDDPLEKGVDVWVIGAPYGQRFVGSVLSGKVVNVDCSLGIGDWDYVNVDVLDCHAGPGCSGGPVVDNRGRVRGVWVGYRPGAGFTFAVPIEELNIDPET